MTGPFGTPAGPPPAFARETDRPDDGRVDRVAQDSRAAAGSPTKRPPSRRRSQRNEVPDDPGRAAAQDREPDPVEVARAIVLRQLTMAPRSRQQLATKLRQKGCEEAVVDQVLDRMEDVGLVDDQAYAQMVVRSQQAGRGLARRALRQELRRKGVDDEVAASTLEDIDDEDERDRARALAEKKMRSMHGLDATVQTRRLAGMLARKGYSSSVAWSVIHEVVADAPEHQRD